MKIEDFKTTAKSYIPNVEVEDKYDNTEVQINQNWSVFVYQHASTQYQPAMVELNIVYTPPRPNAHGRRMKIGMWCYKMKEQDWKLHKPYKMW